MAQHELLPITFIGVEHNDWIRGIAFYLDELKILENRLESISKRQEAMELSRELEQFKQIFRLHQSNLHSLRDAIMNNLKRVERDAECKNNYLSNSTMAEHDAMRDRYGYAEKSIQEIRINFGRFYAKAVRC